MNDVILDNFNEINIRLATKMPLIAIYDHPSDYPDKFVARIWDVDIPTRYAVLRDDLESIREVIPPWMVRFVRSDKDDPVIVETWL